MYYLYVLLFKHILALKTRLSNRRRGLLRVVQLYVAPTRLQVEYIDCCVSSVMLYIEHAGQSCLQADTSHHCR